MSGIITFINNLRYLFRYNLKTIKKDSEEVYYAIEHLKYEIEDDIKSIPDIKIYGVEETIDKLLNSNCSMGRYGDGEYNIMMGGGKHSFSAIIKGISRQIAIYFAQPFFGVYGRNN